MALTKISTGGVKDDAASQAIIADEAIDEARLQISNAGSNGEFLQKQSGNTGGLTWAAVSVPDADKIVEGNSSVEVSDTNSNGTITFTTEGTERLRITDEGRICAGGYTTGNSIGLGVKGTSDSSNIGKVGINSGYSNSPSSADTALGQVIFAHGSGDSGPMIEGSSGGAYSTNNLPSQLKFYTVPGSSTTPTERFRISKDGSLGVAGANYGTSGQVLTSGGASAAPSWAAAGGLWEKIASQSVGIDANTTDITWAHDSSITTTYDSIKLQVIKCAARVIATDAKVISNLYIRFRGRWDGSTSDTWLDTASYRYAGTSYRSTPNTAYEDYSGASPAGTMLTFHRGSGYTTSGELTILDPFNRYSSKGPMCFDFWSVGDWDNEVEPTADSSNNVWGQQGRGNIGMNMSSSSPHDWDFKLTGIRLYFDPSTHGFDAGRVNLYGLKDS